MIFKDISNFSNTADYLPILNGAIITDLVVILRLILGQIRKGTLTEWYKKYRMGGVMADVLSIVIGVIITRYIYSYVFAKFSIFTFAGLAVVVQVIHDLLFAVFFNSIPRGQSEILDTFKDYAKEFGYVILLADAGMMILTIFIASILSGLSLNTNIITLIISLYIVPYFLYSI
uniref:Uncharacterized protein n=1 Tax=viral metagenome TaxID=1070528 RepID=A0A6C0JG20_9ZZZZ